MKVVFLLLLLIVSITGGVRFNDVGQLQHLVDREKFFYADALDFEFRIVLHGGEFISNRFFVHGSISPSSRSFDPSVTDLVFIHSEAGASDFPANVIVAWPRESHIEGLVWGINYMVMRSESDLENRRIRRRVILPEDIGLPLPITATDLVDNWEEVNTILRILDPNELWDIRGFGIVGIPAAHINE